jgi:hypothetical protein
MDGHFALWCARYLLFQLLELLACPHVNNGESSYQLLEDALVQRPFPFPALPELLVLFFQTLPMLSEFR